MGNQNSNAADYDWDSDDAGGGSDYEHAYNFHSSVLHKSPADGFESDYEDDDDHMVLRSSRRLQQTPSPVAEPASVSSPSSASSPGKPQVTPEEDGSNNTESGTAAEGEFNDNEEAAAASAAATAGSESQAQGGRNCEEQQASDLLSSGTGGDRKGSEPGHSQEAGPQRKEHLPQGRKENTNAQAPSPSAIVQNGENRQRQRQVISDQRVEENFESAEEESYETAGEGDGGRGEDSAAASDDDSLSTITPPRTRPQSDSEFSRTAESEEADSDADDDDDDDDETSSSASDNSVAEVYPSRSSRKLPATAHQNSQGSYSQSPASRRSDPQVVTSRSPSIPQRQIPRRQGMSPNTYRQERKRVASPKRGSAAKRNKLAVEDINFSPGRPRFGIFDSESDSETEPASRRTRRSSRTAPTSQSMPFPSPPPPPQQSRRETRSGLSARSLRQAAKRAASQFVETSKKILQDARTAARILRESTSSKRRSSVLLSQDDEDDPMVGGKRRSVEKLPKSSPASRRKAAEQRREEGINQIIMRPVSNRSRGTKRKAEDGITRRTRASRRSHRSDDETDTDMDDLVGNNDQLMKEVRKNGGRLRKFTRTTTAFTSMTRHSACLAVPSQSSSFDPVPVISSAGTANKRTRTSPPGASNSALASMANSPAAAAATNPFQDVTLIPSFSTRFNNSTGSIDSISHELSPLMTGSQSGHLFNGPSPFISLEMMRTETPEPSVPISSGSVWARINTRTVSTTKPQPSTQSGVRESRRTSSTPVPGTSTGSVTRMATRRSPQTVIPAHAISPPYPPRSTPRAPSLTLTGQFAQSGRFAFLLEDVLQVTVTTSSIIMSSTNAVVITTNNQLDHRSPEAETVAKAAGPGFTQACQDYFRHNKKGLQVCEILDTPAGGHLSPVISHVLHVVLPDEKTAGSGDADVKKHKKLLLCSYVNCLKHASEKLSLSSIAFPLFASGTYSADECIQVFFDSLLVYLVERTPTCPLHAIQLVVSNPAIGRFAAEVLEARLEAMVMKSVDVAVADVFREYFNIPDFNWVRSSTTGVAARSPSGKPAVKRRRL